MVKKQKEVVSVAEPVVVEVPTLADVVELHPDVVEDIERKRSVVKAVYKVKYAERAKANGERSKVAQRSAWDWLAQELAAEVLDERQKLIVDRFLRLLDQNGVDHSRWTNRSKGWEGRLRMTGRLALQKVVAETGVLKTAEGVAIEAPAEWVAKFLN
jgi:hypothetical protein